MGAVLLEQEKVYECYRQLLFNFIHNSQGEQNALEQSVIHNRRAEMKPKNQCLDKVLTNKMNVCIFQKSSIDNEN